VSCIADFLTIPLFVLNVQKNLHGRAAGFLGVPNPAEKIPVVSRGSTLMGTRHKGKNPYCTDT
jgi:hypothetical protein